MLEELHAKSGHRILRCDGRLLASREDPVREAARWVSNHRKRFSGRSSVIVLGVGCGYHLELLAKEPTIKKVIGLDYDSSAVEWVATRTENIENLKVSQINKVPEVVKDVVVDSYSVLRYFPSLFVNPAGYERSYRFLLGRSLEGAEFIFSLRKEFSQLQIRNKSEGPISIHDVQLGSGEASSLWRALGELVS